MKSCDSFEQNYTEWKKGELTDEEMLVMQQHSTQCQDCAEFGNGDARLRDLISQVPEKKLPHGFEFRLQRRIQEINSGSSPAARPKTSAITRWSYLGAGLATGVAVSMVIVFSNDPSNPSAPDYAAESVISNVELANQDVNDSLKALEDSAAISDLDFDLDRHSRTVSTGK